MKQRAILGYDKDNDAYETLRIVPTETQRRLLASIINWYHAHVKELRRTACNEPFDWFVITDDTGEIINLYSYDYPDGYDMKKGNMSTSGGQKKLKSKLGWLSHPGE